MAGATGYKHVGCARSRDPPWAYLWPSLDAAWRTGPPPPAPQASTSFTSLQVYTRVACLRMTALRLNQGKRGLSART
jgi:hypothetical protein